VGGTAYSLALVGDHGAALLPERQVARGVEAGRLDATAFRAAVASALTTRFGDADHLIARFEPPEFYLDYAEGQRRGIAPADLDAAVATAARAQPGVAQAYTRSQILAADGIDDPILRAVALTHYPARSGDVYVLVRPNFIFWGAAGTHHGTPYDYDTHVPLIFYGRGVRRAVVPTPVDMRDLAPTLARLAGVELPGLPGHVLEQALDGSQGRSGR
jgi:arylsulfatase A-like enzyme